VFLKKSNNLSFFIFFALITVILKLKATFDFILKIKAIKNH